MAKRDCPIDLLGAECVADPYPAYRLLRDTAPVCWTRSGFWLVTRHADVSALLTDGRCDHWGQQQDQQQAPRKPQKPQKAQEQEREPRESMDAALAQALRRLAPVSTASGGLRRTVAAVIARHIDALAELTMIECEAQLASLRGLRTLEVMGDYAHPITCRAISRLLGVPHADLDALTDLVASLDGDLFSPAPPLRDYLRRLVAAKRAHPGDDLISAILTTNAVDAPDADAEQPLLPLILLLFHAGHRNMMNFIGNALLALMDAPDSLAALRRSSSPMTTATSMATAMARAVPELLRYDSPVQHIALVCRERFVLHDQAIAPGDPIFACVGSANRDPAAFADADRLDLARPAPNHLSFGIGAWRCMGAKLAERQGATALACLLAQLPSFRLSSAEDAAAPVTWRRTPVVQRGPARLTIELDPHD